MDKKCFGARLMIRGVMEASRRMNGRSSGKNDAKNERSQVSGSSFPDGKEPGVADTPGVRAYSHLCIIRGSGHRGNKERGPAGCHHTCPEAITGTDEGSRRDKPCGSRAGSRAVFSSIHGATKKEQVDSELSSRPLLTLQCSPPTC